MPGPEQPGPSPEDLQLPAVQEASRPPKTDEQVAEQIGRIAGMIEARAGTYQDTGEDDYDTIHTATRHEGDKEWYVHSIGKTTDDVRVSSDVGVKTDGTVSLHKTVNQVKIGATGPDVAGKKNRELIIDVTTDDDGKARLGAAKLKTERFSREHSMPKTEPLTREQTIRASADILNRARVTTNKAKNAAAKEVNETINA